MKIFILLLILIIGLSSCGRQQNTLEDLQMKNAELKYKLANIEIESKSIKK